MNDVESDTLTLRKAFSKEDYCPEEFGECDMLESIEINACPFEEHLAPLQKSKRQTTYFAFKEDENPF